MRIAEGNTSDTLLNWHTTCWQMDDYYTRTGSGGMVRLFCSCGYPILVSARWTGADILLILQDGQQEPTRDAESLVHCPRCHQRLMPADLTWLAPPIPPWRALLPDGRPSRDRASPGKILVVDDDEEIREVLQDVLADAGFQVQGARDGTEALKLLHREGGWVVLLDLMMPRMDGWQVIRRLQQEPALLKDSQIVLMSAGWRLDREGWTLSSAPVVASLRKPVDVEELLSLARHLSGKDGS